MEFETNAEACLVSEALGEPCPWPGLVALPTALQWVLWAFDVEALGPMDLHVSRVNPAQLSLDDDPVVQAEQALAETRGSRDPGWFSEPACTTADVA